MYALASIVGVDWLTLNHDTSHHVYLKCCHVTNVYQHARYNVCKELSTTLAL